MDIKEKNERLISLLDRSFKPIQRLIRLKQNMGHTASVKELIVLYNEIAGELGKTESLLTVDKTTARLERKNLLAGARMTVSFESKDTEELTEATRKYSKDEHV